MRNVEMIEAINITQLLGWCVTINIGFIVFYAICITFFKDRILKMDKRLLDLDESKLNEIYIYSLAKLKILTILFFLTPYLALKIIQITG